MRFYMNNKKIVSSIIVIVMILSMISNVNVFEAFAALEGGCGTTCKPNTVKWSLDEESGVMTITGESMMLNFGSTAPGWDEYRDLIKKIVIKNGVENIGDFAFKYCKNLKSVVIENGVTRIGSRAFIGCRALESVSIPDSITKIDDNAFHGCISLDASKLNIPEGAIIGEGAFNTQGSYEIMRKTKELLSDYFDKLIVTNDTEKAVLSKEMYNLMQQEGLTSSAYFLEFTKINATTDNAGSIVATVAIHHNIENENITVTKQIDKLIVEENNTIQNSTAQPEVSVQPTNEVTIQPEATIQPTTEVTTQPTNNTEQSKETENVFVKEEAIVDNYKVTIGDNYITIGWIVVKGATGYKISVLKNGQWSLIKDSSTPCFRYNNIELGLTYSFAIRAYNKTGDVIVLADEYKMITVPTTKKETTTNETTTNETTKQPSNSTGSKSGNSTGSQPSNSTGSQLGNNTGSQPGNSTGSQPSKDTEQKVEESLKLDPSKEPETTDEPEVTKEPEKAEEPTKEPTKKPETVFVKKEAKVKKVKTKVDNTAINIGWSKVEGATGYRIFVLKNGKWTKVKDTNNTSYKVNNLKQGTSYKFAIRAYNKSDDKVIWADEYKTINSFTKPVQVTKFTIKSKSKTAVSTTWKKTTGASGYRLYIEKNGKWVKVGTIKGNNYTFKGLKKNTKYKFAVKAYKTDGKNTVFADKCTILNIKTSK